MVKKKLHPQKVEKQQQPQEEEEEGRRRVAPATYQASVQELLTCLDAAQEHWRVAANAGDGPRTSYTTTATTVLHVWTQTKEEENDDDDKEDDHVNDYDWKCRSRRRNGRPRSHSESSPAAGNGSITTWSSSQQQQQAQQAQRLTQRRGRSNSLNETTTTTSTPEFSNKKKVHPRSRQQQQAQQQPHLLSLPPENPFIQAPSLLLLCRSHFFTGICSTPPVVSSPSSSRSKAKGGGGGGSRCCCRYRHVTPPGRNLASTVYRSVVVTAAAPEPCSGGRSSSTSSSNTDLQRAHEASLLPIHGNRNSSRTTTTTTRLERNQASLAMEMVHYIPIPITMASSLTSTVGEPSEVSSSEKEQPPSIREIVTITLSNRGVNVSSIVYAVLQGTLIFDRHQGGLLISSQQEMMTILARPDAEREQNRESDPVSDRKASYRKHISFASFSSSSLSNDSANQEEMGRRLVQELPGSILEHILTFLPDASVAAASQVCQSWYQEIGRNSPNLWRHLLQRRNWPLPVDLERTSGNSINVEEGEEDEGEDSSSGEVAVDHEATADIGPEPYRQMYRNAFLQHYAVVRDVAAIQLAMSALHNNNNNKRRSAAVEEKEMVYQDFSTRKHSPSAPNHCVAVQVWSPNRILVAYSLDCSLRLFETVPKSSQEKMCRELVSQRIDPYRNTKKRTCSLLSMTLDEEAIGCLCHVMADTVDVEAYVLIVVSRDEFLLGDSSCDKPGQSSNSTKMNVIDIGAAVLNYLLSLDVVDHRMLQLIDFLTDGGEIGEVEILASETIAACGYGRFMVEVSISIPFWDGFDLVDSMQLLDRKLVLFSASAGAIVWMGDSNDPLRPLRPRHEDMTLACYRRPLSGCSSRAECSVVVTSASSPSIQVASVERTGYVQNVQIIKASDSVRNEAVGDDWEVIPSHCRLLIVTASDVVAADVASRRVGGRIKELRTIISFYPRYPKGQEAPYSVLKIDGDFEALRMANFRDTHAIIICRKYSRATDQNPGENGTAETTMSLYAIIIHIFSRSEIARMSLAENVARESGDVIEISISNEYTIGAGLSWKGVMMTGSDIRTIGNSKVALIDDVQTKPKSKKTKRQPPKGGKKDVFCRGMTLRG